MNIFITVSGPVFEGLDTPTRGEGRWCLNMARCLADAGHKVLLSEHGGEVLLGKSQKHPNVEIIQWRNLARVSHIVFDVYFTVNHIPGNPYPVKAKRVLSGIYSLGSLMDEPEVSRVQDELYVLAPERHTHEKYSKALGEKNISWKDRYKLLCQPYGKKLGKSKFDKKTIIFSAKDVFDPILERLQEDARKNIFAAIDACKATGANFVAVSSDWNNPRYTPALARLGIFDKIKEIPNFRILPILPWKQLMVELAQGSILVPLAFAGCTPDALFSGLVPLLTEDSMLIKHPGVEYENLIEEMGNSFKQSQDEVKNTLVRLLTEEDYYNHFQRELQKMMVDNLDENVLKQFYDIIEYDENRIDKNV